MQPTPTLDATGGWETLFEGDARKALEESVLPWFISRQWWFGGKARTIRHVRIVDLTGMQGASPEVF